MERFYPEIRRHAQETPDRQSRRDRHPHRPGRRRTRHRHRSASIPRTTPRRCMSGGSTRRCALKGRRRGGLSRHRRRDRGGQKGRLRSGPSGLRLPRRRTPTSRRPAPRPGSRFVGPTPEQLKLFGDKARARAHAAKCKVPVLPGTDGATDLAGATAFFRKHAKAGIALKAIAGGGGRGMRLIKSDEARSPTPSPAARPKPSRPSATALSMPSGWSAARATSRCRSWATARAASWPWASANAPCSGAARRSSSWRPAPTSSPALRKKIVEAAVAMAKAVKYRSLGTFEFLVDERRISSSSRPIRACRSSTPSPRRYGASIW